MKTMDAARHELIRDRLRAVLREIKEQPHHSEHFGGASLSFDEEMEQIREYIEDAAEYGVAYESLVASLEQVPFIISVEAAAGFLEAGQLMGYQTRIPAAAIAQSSSPRGGSAPLERDSR